MFILLRGQKEPLYLEHIFKSTCIMGILESRKAMGTCTFELFLKCGKISFVKINLPVIYISMSGRHVIRLNLGS